MDTTTETTSLERTISIAAPPETVWDFLVDPEKAVRWMGQTCTFDAQPGGIYRCNVIPGHTASGEFVELDPPHRLVFTWGWENHESVPPGSSTVEIDLIADESGTTLHFVHNLASAEAARSHSVGWDHYLPRLELAATGRDPGEDPWVTQAPPM